MVDYDLTQHDSALNLAKSEGKRYDSAANLPKSELPRASNLNSEGRF